MNKKMAVHWEFETFARMEVTEMHPDQIAPMALIGSTLILSLMTLALLLPM